MRKTTREANAKQHEETSREEDERTAMIDISAETLIPLREAPRRLPPRPNGKRVHISACYRWISRGVRGVHLESIKVGGSTYTSLEALQQPAVKELVKQASGYLPKLKP